MKRNRLHPSWSQLAHNLKSVQILLAIKTAEEKKIFIFVHYIIILSALFRLNIKKEYADTQLARLNYSIDLSTAGQAWVRACILPVYKNKTVIPTQ